MQAKRGLHPPVYIDSDPALEKLVHALHNKSMIAVDTEANSLFAYRERLCLIQISTRDQDYLVDPQSGIDLGRLVGVFADPSIVKVFHDAEFDILMLKRTLPIEVLGVFDTKVAAMSLGLPEVGLAPILKEFFSVTLDKKHQRSDWGQRPLSDAQLDYARYDTHFLIPLAEDLRERLLEAETINQLEVAAEFRRVEQVRPEERPFDPDGFTRIKGWDRLDPAQRRVLRELFVMRHEIADAHDRPAFKVLPNDVLLLLAEKQPESIEALGAGRVMSARQCDRYGEAVVGAIARGRRLSPLPDGKIPRRKSEQESLTEDQRDAHEALREWRKHAAVERGVDSSLVMPKAMLFELSRQRVRPKTIEALGRTGVLEPWRVSYYGAGIVAALAQLDVPAGGPGGAEGGRPRRRSKKRNRST